MIKNNKSREKLGHQIANLWSRDLETGLSGSTLDNQLYVHTYIIAIHKSVLYTCSSINHTFAVHTWQ